MIVLEYKVKGKQHQYDAIDEAIRTTQFIRNKAIRYWMDAPSDSKIDRFALNKYSTLLREEFSFVAELSTKRQAGSYIKQSGVSLSLIKKELVNLNFWVSGIFNLIISKILSECV